MIVKIHKSGTMMAPALNYNYSKVRHGEAQVIAIENMSAVTPSEVADCFAARERRAVRDLDHVVFQMSVNPGPTDSIQEAEISAFVAEMMEGLGYGDQPWIIFRHNDIERTHYHVVSIRINEKGRKIKDYYEHRKCERLARSLEAKYGYTLGNGPEGTGAQEEAPDVTIPMFNRENGDIIAQFQACVDHSLTYRFSTQAQFAEILRCHRVGVREGISPADVMLQFQGLDGSGVACTPIINDRQLREKVFPLIEERISVCEGIDLSREKDRLKEDVREAVESSRSFTAAERLLNAKGVEVMPFRDRNGEIRGLTLIDHRTLCAFKASEVSRTYAATLVRMAQDEQTGGRREQAPQQGAPIQQTGASRERIAVPVETGYSSSNTREESDKDIFESVGETLGSVLEGLLSTPAGGGGTGGVKKRRDDDEDDKKKRRRRRR